MADDSKISGLTADTSPSTDDFIVTVNDPSGTPANKKVTLANVTKALDLTVLTEDTAPASDSLIFTTDAPGTTPVLRKVTGANLTKALDLTVLTEDTNPANDTIFLTMDAPGTSPVLRKVQGLYLARALDPRMYQGTGATNSVYIGVSAPDAATGLYNVGIGDGSFAALTSGNYNFAIGGGVLSQLTTGTGDVAVGVGTMQYSFAAGDYNTAIGGGTAAQCGYGGNGSGITAIGYNAGALCHGGSVMLGYYAGYNERAGNKLYIGNDQDKCLIHGDFSTLKVSIKGSFGGGITLTSLAVPTGLAVAAQGTTGATTWGYKITSRDKNGETLACAEVQITNGNATLDNTNYNRITWTRVDQAVDYHVFRITAGGTPNTTGIIATVVDDSDMTYAPYTGLIRRLDDKALAGGSESVPTADTTGCLKCAGPNATGAGTALLGTNSPAGTVAAPYTWLKAISSDGTIVWIPAWT